MIYFDNAATTSPKPDSVREAVAFAMKNLSVNPGRSSYNKAMEASKLIYECRIAVADFFEFPSPERVIFTSNCTHAINTVIKGLNLKSGNIVTSSLEHNAVMRPLEKCKKAGCEIRIAEVFFDDPSATVRSFARLIDDQTKLVICLHGSNVCGILLPIDKIGKLCKDRKVPFAVDAAQTAGVIPISMKEMNIDYLCLPGHKGLYGPMGTGVLLCGGMLPNTLMEGGTGSFSIQPFQPEELPERLESGTVNVPGIAGLKAGIEFVKLKTPKRIHEYEMGLLQQAYQGLKNTRKVTLYTPYPKSEQYTSVLSFNINQLHSMEAAEKLSEGGFALRAGLHCAPNAHRRLGTVSYGTVRFAPSVFNNRGEVSRFLNYVSKISK